MSHDYITIQHNIFRQTKIEPKYLFHFKSVKFSWFHRRYNARHES